jgi:hypothetical protein
MASPRYNSGVRGEHTLGSACFIGDHSRVAGFLIDPVAWMRDVSRRVCVMARPDLAGCPFTPGAHRLRLERPRQTIQAGGRSGVTGKFFSAPDLSRATVPFEVAHCRPMLALVCAVVRARLRERRDLISRATQIARAPSNDRIAVVGRCERENVPRHPPAARRLSR